MESVRLGIVGCGGMGRRHLAGLAELRRTGDQSVDLVAVCDLNTQNASDLADEAATLLGGKPQVFGGVEEMVRQSDGLEAADCTTDSGSHHRVATDLLDLGLHTLVEKPLALTIKGCDRVIAAVERSGKILSVAENYRRDPMNRLAKALLDDGAIGERQFIMESAVRGRDDMIITPWRHQKRSGTIPVDAGVHNADILQYYFGDVASAFGQTRLFHPVRTARNLSGPGGFYEKWAKDVPEKIEATGEDAIFGMIAFANGALGQWIDHHAGHGLPLQHRLVFGTSGSLSVPVDRSGKPIRLTLDDGTDISDGGILDFAPSYRLDSVTAALFGDERPWSYSFDFATTDRKLLATEYAELASCIRNYVQPEVDGAIGRRAMALVLALFESQIANRPVTIAEIEAGEIDAWQRDIDDHYGLV